MLCHYGSQNTGKNWEYFLRHFIIIKFLRLDASAVASHAAEGCGSSVLCVLGGFGLGGVFGDDGSEEGGDGGEDGGFVFVVVEAGDGDGAACEVDLLVCGNNDVGGMMTGSQPNCFGVFTVTLTMIRHPALKEFQPSILTQCWTWEKTPQNGRA